MRIIRYSLLFLIVFLVVTASGQTLRIPPNTTETSTVTVTQPSNGVISGWGISCGTSATDCAESFLNFTTVTLTATPDSGAVFNGWSGACADRGTNTTCTLTLSAGVAVAASFTLTTRNLTITKAGTGAGHVYDADFNVICSDACTSYSHDYPLSTSVTIHAWATSPDTWDGYSGNCSGTGENPPLHDCTLTMSSDKAVTVTFTTGTSFTMYAKPALQGGLSTGTCTTIATACTVARALSLVTAGQSIGLLGTNPATDGLYQGANDMLNLASFAAGKSGTSDTNRITVAAVSDGGVLIDGQYARTPVRTEGHSYWTFKGFDAAHGTAAIDTASVIAINEAGTPSTGLVFQRICAYDAAPTIDGNNAHVWLTASSYSGLFEDLCGFGIGGRNMFLTSFGSGGQTNTYRRIWARHDGYAARPVVDRACQANAAQLGYHDREPYNDVYEDWIVIHSYDKMPTSDPCYSPTSSLQTGTDYLFAGQQGRQMSGIIGYTTSPVFYALNMPGIYLGVHCSIDVARTFTDLFIDYRNHKVAPFYIDGACITANRLTGLKTTASDSDTWSNNPGLVQNHSIFVGGTFTNTNECTTTAACPDFYTGGTSPVGARNCFEYTDGVLGSATTQRKWPWRMDDRIKAALARAGKTALQGTAGTGYAANTVTSEIVSRYGAVPSACLR